MSKIYKVVCTTQSVQKNIGKLYPVIVLRVDQEYELH